MRQFVLIVPDGAADADRMEAKSPLARARTPYMDFLAREGVTGLAQTLYEEMPKESLVAQMGMLGWDPHLFYPGGRSSCELLAHDRPLAPGDIVFRANLATVEQGILRSYSAFAIDDDQAAPLVRRLQSRLGAAFPEFALHHTSDFRTSLVVHDSGTSPAELVCREPHECEGEAMLLSALVVGRTAAGRRAARRINAYLSAAGALLEHERANALLPWSVSGPIRLPPFAAVNAITGRAVVVGAMDFLHGLAIAGQMEFVRVGNGRPATDYRGKGQTTVRLLDEGAAFVCCHINAPDEASHAHDVSLKVATIERIDAEVLRPVIAYFQQHPRRLGGVMVIPDHYANCHPRHESGRRVAAHSTDPVPFALWNGRETDATVAFSEDEAATGRYAHPVVGHLDLLPLLLGDARIAAVGAAGGR